MSKKDFQAIAAGRLDCREGAMESNRYLDSLPPRMLERARAALDAQVRVNGQAFMTRGELIRQRIANGAQVTLRGDDWVLMNPDGSWLDERAITRHGVKYAAAITSSADLCSVCRERHGIETVHECE